MVGGKGASSSEELRELGGTCPDLPLAPSALSWKKEPYLWSLSPAFQGLQQGLGGFKSMWAFQFPRAGTGGDR